MIKWTKTGRQVEPDGGSTVFYQSDDDRIRIESRKRAIEHANRGGYWLHTSYFLIANGAEKEFYSLRDAKEAAEKLLYGWGMRCLMSRLIDADAMMKDER